MYGHFGDGCIHCRINFDLVTADGIKTWRKYLDEATNLVVSYGGSISGEHGDGQSRQNCSLKCLEKNWYSIQNLKRFGTLKENESGKW
jgi:FAD/FMN-containing dehydrogenase